MQTSNIVIEQVLNKILSSGNINFITENDLTEEYFPGYEDEYYFIVDHFRDYHTVPDKITFGAEFQDFTFFDVEEPDEYLYKQLFDLRYYNHVAEAWEDIRAEVAIDPVRAMEEFKSMLSEGPQQKSSEGIDIIKQAADRLHSLTERSSQDKPFYIKTGFDELDTVINGWARGEEFAVLFGRTGHGKSYVLLKTLLSACLAGNRVGLISPEMSYEKVGYRIDTLMESFSNTSLNTARIVEDDNEFDRYANHITKLVKSDNFFKVATLKDFQKKVTVSKLRSFILKNKLDILAIDGITYLQDERRRRGDNKTTMLTNISEDLITLSVETHIPILVVVQSNREGSKGSDEEGTPEIENIRDSDGIAHSATKVISIRQRSNMLEIAVKKHRDGKVGDTFSYYCDFDKGDFQFEEVEKAKAKYSRPANETSSSYNSYPENNSTKKKKVRDF